MVVFKIFNEGGSDWQGCLRFTDAGDKAGRQSGPSAGAIAPRGRTSWLLTRLVPLNQQGRVPRVRFIPGRM